MALATDPPLVTDHDDLLADFLEAGEDEEDFEDEEKEEDAEDKVKEQANGLKAEDLRKTDKDVKLEHAVDGDVEMGDASITRAAAAGKSFVSGYETAEEAREILAKVDLSRYDDIRSVAGLAKSLKPVLEKVERYLKLPPGESTAGVGLLEDDPEFKLSAQANFFASQIDNEIVLIHKWLIDHYSKKFPELQTLVPNPIDYAKAVAVIGNRDLKTVETTADKKDNILGIGLSNFLDKPTVMVTKMEGATSTGVDLSQDELTNVLAACQMAVDIDNARKQLTEYVQSRMELFAPNLTALVGAETAGLLVNYAGGLNGLAKIPACNIPAQGANKQNFGFANNTRIRSQGYVYHSPLLEEVPSDLRRQGVRIISAKVVLAARMDAARTSRDGAMGRQLREDILNRLDKIAEAPKYKGSRALPAPNEKTSRKRGGKLARKAKEAIAPTEIRTAKNRMAFGEEEATVGYGDETEGLGMLGKQNDGRIRALQVDHKTKAKLSKKNAGWGKMDAGDFTSLNFGPAVGGATSLKAHGLRTTGINTGAVPGSTTVLAKDVGSGIEMANPAAAKDAERKRKLEEGRWFGGGSTVDADGFKKPALPALKRVKMEK